MGADRHRGRHGPVWVRHVRDRHVTVREVITNLDHQNAKF